MKFGKNCGREWLTARIIARDESRSAVALDYNVGFVTATNISLRRLRAAVIYLFISICCFALGYSQANSANSVQKEKPLMTHASGSFEVRLAPQETYNKSDSMLGRMSIDKQFHGPLEATSKGEMLTAGTNVKGSAGYVAIERVTGTLNGKSGSFALQHFATMTRGAPQLTIIVVPDSGTGELGGLSGKLNIRIENGKHFYDLDYTLEETR